ncbi:MAG: PSD1 and planctomycete cytochrome C domain-containing protein [Fuerstiella sp.]|nr:PSD1 and planctomycete cytochrome C domain-containing protein [Fuerstiella sp.]
MLNHFPLAVCLWAFCGTLVIGEDTVSFSRDIRPILSDRCFQCHGPNEEARQAELRLDIDDEKEGPFRDRNGRRVIQPKDPLSSELWYRLTTDDESERMPPSDSHLRTLTVSEKALVRSWILQGAQYDDFWAFVPPLAATPPYVEDPQWQSPIDRFVLARLNEKNLRPQSGADRRTLIRRVTFDLTGLPPGTDDIRRFANNSSPQAWEILVDRLLAAPSYGEHMAKYWLDLVRFADTNGIHHDHYRETTPYRDWVIRAFNNNLRFDDFITYQIAGDLYEESTIDQQIASGFNRLHLVIDRGTALPEESYTRNVVDRVSAFGTAFLGLTLGCAACHDHKYDPLSQREFYQLFAFFNNIDTEPETPGRNSHHPVILLPTSEQGERLRQIENGIEFTGAKIKELTDVLSKLSSDDSVRKSDVEILLKSKKERLEILKKELDAVERTVAVSLVSKERTDIRPAYLLIRGAYDRPGEQVERNTPGFLPGLNAAGSTVTRMDLSHWLTQEQHPLTARVAVNRFWQQFFGVGLVKTSEDFGAQGEYPSHPELLDYLAVRFVESGWNVKELVRSIVLSQTYRQSSRAPASAFREDPENRLLARGSRFRLDSEMIRDQILSVSGLLNESMYGRSVKPPQPPNLWKSVSMVSSSTYAFEADAGDNIYRRSLYSFWKRAMPPPQMTIFDAPTRESCIARRERTNTPLQALVLMNESQYFAAAENLVHRILVREQRDDQLRLAFAFESVTSHLPGTTELMSLRNGLTAFRAAYRDDLESARAMTTDTKQASDAERVEIAAWTMLINSLFSLDAVKTRE